MYESVCVLSVDVYTNACLCASALVQVPVVYVFLYVCVCVQVRWGSQGQEMLQGSADGCRKPINLVCVFPDPSFS